MPGSDEASHHHGLQTGADTIVAHISLPSSLSSLHDTIVQNAKMGMTVEVFYAQLGPLKVSFENKFGVSLEYFVRCESEASHNPKVKDTLATVAAYLVDDTEDSEDGVVVDLTGASDSDDDDENGIMAVAAGELAYFATLGCDTGSDGQRAKSESVAGAADEGHGD